MVLRVERNAESAAILSFPRDLWVRINGSNRKSRINNAFDKADPSRLVRTIEDNFGVTIDHYVDVDFCAFKKMVEVVGGVKVPFAYPTRDRYSGLNVTEPRVRDVHGRRRLGLRPVPALRVQGRRRVGGRHLLRLRPHRPPAGLHPPGAAEGARSGRSPAPGREPADRRGPLERDGRLQPDRRRHVRPRHTAAGLRPQHGQDLPHRRGGGDHRRGVGDPAGHQLQAGPGHPRLLPGRGAQRRRERGGRRRVGRRRRDLHQRRPVHDHDVGPGDDDDGGSTTTTKPPRAGSTNTTVATSTTLDAVGRPDDFVTGIIPPDDPTCR